MPAEHLTELVASQKTALAALERELEALLRADVRVENDALKAEVAGLRAALEDTRARLSAATAQAAELKNALFEQVYSERIQILHTAQKKADAYFMEEAEGELNRLARLTRDLTEKAGQIADGLKRHRVDSADALYAQLSELSVRANEALTTAKARLAAEQGAFSEYSAKQFDKLKAEQITDETLAAIGRKNNIEAFVGGNLLNKLGILFVILGIIAVSRFTFFRLPDTFKGIIMFAVSAAFLLAGEYLNRRRANVFSLGVTAGGVAGMYVSLTISYFWLLIIPMYPAIAMCILITTVAFVLSQRYNAQTIAAFALLGGYLPILSISESMPLVYAAMVYFVILNLLALGISFYKRWKISMFIGFFLNLAGTYYVILQMSWFAPLPYSPGLRELGVAHALTLLYVFFAFAIYTLIPVLGSYRAKAPFTKPDIVVLALNTVLSALYMYALFAEYGLTDFDGILTLGFAVVYVALGRFLQTRFAAEKRATTLFYLTGLAFVVLVVPMQFGMQWLSLGWLAQGTVLVVYGILTNDRVFKKAGAVIGALCGVAFLLLDVYLGVDDLFAYKYFAITAASVSVLAALAYKKSLARAYERAFTYAVLVNGWVYGVYLWFEKVELLLGPLYGTAYDISFLIFAVMITITFLYAAVLPRITPILDRGVKIISIVLSVIGMLLSALLTGVLPVWYPQFIPSETVPFTGEYLPIPASVYIICTLILIALAALAVLALRNVLLFFVLEASMPVEWLPFGLSAYFLIILTQNLVMQYGLEMTSMIISIVYVAAALAWIVFGFARRYAYMRRFGLGLSILAVAKLFLVDLPVGLTQGYKIISYFAFGLTLLGISFVYQYFSRRIAPKEGDGA